MITHIGILEFAIHISKRVWNRRPLTLSAHILPTVGRNGILAEIGQLPLDFGPCLKSVPVIRYHGRAMSLDLSPVRAR